ncbi:MAG TPA: hypothetical protein DCZ04_16815, partial [Syntrophorhabdus aromaticivorans]|nr:hypothetical protein [Syntrophorhabdus aromaticivorans]
YWLVLSRKNFFASRAFEDFWADRGLEWNETHEGMVFLHGCGKKRIPREHPAASEAVFLRIRV